MEENQNGKQKVAVVCAPVRIFTIEEIAKLEELYDIEFVEKQSIPELPEEFFLNNVVEPMDFKEPGKFLHGKKMDRILGRNKRGKP